MRLIHHYSLTFSRSGSTKVKVFEIDLCEVGSSRFVVNYRYGRQGHPLRDGTRTLSPVSRSEADHICDRLLNDKLRSGYRISAQSPQASAPSSPPAAAPAPPAQPVQTHTVNPVWASQALPTDGPDLAGAASREETILRWLDWHAAPPDGVRAKWPLHRVVWRAGELSMSSATPKLIKLLGREDGADYAIVWALGRCGGPGALEAVQAQQSHKSGAVQHIAISSLSRLLPPEQRAVWAAARLDQVPAAIRGALGSELIRAIREHLSTPHLFHLYTAEQPTIHAALHGLIAILQPAQPVELEALRCLLKLAEHGDDVALLAAVLSRLEATAADIPTAAREKLLRRPWRILRRLHEDGDSRWLLGAESALLALSDADHPAASTGRLFEQIAAVVSALPLSEQTLALMHRARCQAVVEAISARLTTAELTPTFLTALLTAEHAAVRTAGRRALASLPVDTVSEWIAESYEELLKQPALLGAAALHTSTDIQEAVRSLLVRSPLEAAARQALIRALIEASLQGASDPCAAYAVETLWLVMPTDLRELPDDTVAALVRSGTPALQALGGARLRSWPKVPDELLAILLASPHVPARAAGVQILQGLSDGLLLQHEASILTLCRDPDADIRQGGAGLLGRLLSGSSGARIAADLMAGADR